MSANSSIEWTDIARPLRVLDGREWNESPAVAP